MNSTNIKRNEVKAIIAATFYDYNGRKIKVVASQTVTLHDLNWSGGTRYKYKACTIDGKPLGDSSAYNDIAPWNNYAEGAVVPIPSGCVMVSRGCFCGHDTGLTIYVNPSDMPKLLEITA